MSVRSPSPGQPRCVQANCRQFMPHWDTHDMCWRCRPFLCSEESTCEQCEEWSVETWAECSNYLSTRIQERIPGTPDSVLSKSSAGSSYSRKAKSKPSKSKTDTTNVNIISTKNSDISINNNNSLNANSGSCDLIESATQGPATAQTSTPSHVPGYHYPWAPFWPGFGPVSAGAPIPPGFGTGPTGSPAGSFGQGAQNMCLPAGSTGLSAGSAGPTGPAAPPGLSPANSFGAMTGFNPFQMFGSWLGLSPPALNPITQLFTGSGLIGSGANPVSTGQNTSSAGSNMTVSASQSSATGSNHKPTGPNSDLTGINMILTGSEPATVNLHSVSTGSEVVSTGSKPTTSTLNPCLTGQNLNLTGSDPSAASLNMGPSGSLQDTTGDDPCKLPIDQVSSADEMDNEEMLDSSEESSGSDNEPHPVPKRRRVSEPVVTGQKPVETPLNTGSVGHQMSFGASKSLDLDIEPDKSKNISSSSGLPILKKSKKAKTVPVKDVPLLPPGPDLPEQIFDDEDKSSEDEENSAVEKPLDETLSYLDKLRLVLETQKAHLPAMPQKKRKIRSSLIGSQVAQDPEPVPQLPLAEGVRVELAARREELGALSHSKSKFLKRPKQAASWYHCWAEDFLTQAPKASPELIKHVKGSAPVTKLEVATDAVLHMEAAMRTSMHMSSFSDWFLATSHSLMDDVLKKLEKGEALSPEVLMTQLKASNDLLQSVAKSFEDRLQQDSYTLWVLTLLRRDAYLNALSFPIEPELRTRLRSAPLCTEPDSPGPAVPQALFGGMASELELASKEAREKRRDDALFKIPLLPARNGQKNRPKKSGKKKKVPPSQPATTQSDRPQSQPFRTPLVPYPSPKKTFGGKGRGKKGPNKGKSFIINGKLCQLQGFTPRTRSLSKSRSRSGRALMHILEELGTPRGQSLDCNGTKERVFPEVSGKSSSITNSNAFFPSNFSHKENGPRSRDPGDDKEGSSGTGSVSVSWVLQQGVCSSQSFGGLETRHRSVLTESVSESSKVLDGDSRVNQVSNASGCLDSVIGPKGCVFSYPCSSQGQEIPPVCVPRQSLAIPSPPLWPCPSSMDLHHGCQASASASSQAGVVFASIPRRLAVAPPVSSGIIGTQRRSVRSVCRVGSCDKPEKIRTGSETELRFSGLSLRYPNRLGFPPSRQVGKTVAPGSPISSQSASVSPGMAISFGSDVILREAYPDGQTSHEAYSVGSKDAVVSSLRFPRYASSGVSFVCQRPRMVARSGPCIHRFPIQTPIPNSSSVYRCFQGGMGSSLGFQSDIRLMDRRFSSLAHQCPGIGYSKIGSGALGGSYVGSGSSCSYRQLDSGLLYKQAGWDTVPLFADACQTITSVVSRETYCDQGQAYPWQAQCSGRLPLPERADSSDRVVPLSPGFFTPVCSLGLPFARSVCHSLECQTQSICLSNSGPQCLASGCSVHGLGGSVCICIPSHSHNTTGFGENSFISVQNHVNSSSLARQELVSGPIGTPGGSSSSVTTQTEPAQAAKDIHISQSASEPEPSRLLVVERSLRKKGFSQEVSSRIARPNRLSSLAVYQSKWAVFAAWCHSRQVDPLKASVPLISEFLTAKFNEGRASSTLDGYRTAIAKTIVHYTGVDLGQDRDLSALLHSFALERSRVRNPVPDWDLSLVLNCLLKDPFEPLERAPLKLLTWKTVFLISLASGKRRGEIHALSYKAVAWSADELTVFLKVVPSFVAKCQLASAPPLAFSIPALDHALGQDMEKDRLLCPIRALKIYLARTKEMREDKALLFVSFKPGFKKDIRRPTISSWIKKLVRTCYEISCAVPPGPLSVRAHDVRALSASLAFAAKVPIEKVMEACSWSCHNTFTSFYLRDLALSQGEVFRLGPLVVAQSVVQGR